MIRLLLIEDRQSIRAGLARLLSGEKGILVVGDLDIEDDILRLAARLWPHIVLINTDYMVSQVLPMIDGMKAGNPTCSVLILSDPTKRGMLPSRRRAPELSFVVKGTPVPALADAIRRIARGEQVVDRRLQIASIRTEKTVTTRELEILGLVALGDSVAEIASRLHLAVGTVRNYLSSAIMKNGARNRIDAIRIARRDGWLR